MQTSYVELLFPTPVMFNSINRNFTNDELLFIEKHSKLTNNNIGNMTSNNTYILNEPEMTEINNAITHYVNQYIKNIYKPKNPIYGYITQSWINYVSKDEFHHKHEHPNSFISGCIYIDVNEDVDTITFHKPGYNQLKISTDQHEIYNAESWWFKIRNGIIVLFPSGLTHSVENVKSDKTRISIAFNTFIKGKLGNNIGLTELTI